ncbi:MAG TPA: DedA family protein [Gemmatimonadota bacterium]
MQESILEFLVPYLTHYGYPTLLLVTFLETSAFLGLVAPGETVVVLCGFYAYRGVLDPWAVGAVATFGAILGDQAGYLLGRTWGHELIKRFGKYVFFDLRRMRATERYYAKHGGKTVFIGRFTSILRSFGPLVAGISRMSYWTFLRWSVVSCIIWGATFTVLGYFFGKSWEVIEGYLGWGGVVAFVIGLGLVFWFLHRRREHELEEIDPDLVRHARESNRDQTERKP